MLHPLIGEPSDPFHIPQQAWNASAATLRSCEARLQRAESGLKGLMAQIERLHQLEATQASLDDLTRRLADLERRE